MKAVGYIRRFAAEDPVACICLLMACLQCYVLLYPDPLLMVEPDSIGYLGPAVDAIERGNFSHWYGRGFVFPLFLWGVLSISPEPFAVVLAQRLLVMLTYLCLSGIVWLRQGLFKALLCHRDWGAPGRSRAIQHACVMIDIAATD